jgi:hypothetical protein
MSEEKQYPSLGQQVKNLAQFSWDLVQYIHKSQGDPLTVSDEIAEERVKVCQKCEWYDATQHRCKNCGCYLAPKVKISLESCPIGAWSSTQSDWMENFDQLLDKIQKEEDIDNEQKSD